MVPINRVLIEKSLEEGDLTPLLAIGTIVAKEIMANNSCLVGLNMLEELQIEKSSTKLTFPVNYKEMNPIELAKMLVDKGAHEEVILKILEEVCSEQ